MDNTPTTRNGWQRHWKWLVPVGCMSLLALLALLIIIAIVAVKLRLDQWL